MNSHSLNRLHAAVKKSSVLQAAFVQHDSEILYNKKMKHVGNFRLPQNSCGSPASRSADSDAIAPDFCESPCVASADVRTKCDRERTWEDEEETLALGRKRSAIVEASRLANENAQVCARPDPVLPIMNAQLDAPAETYTRVRRGSKSSPARSAKSDASLSGDEECDTRCKIMSQMDRPREEQTRHHLDEASSRGRTRARARVT